MLATFVGIGLGKVLAGTAFVSGAGIGAFALARFKSVPANKFMAKTGPFVKDVHVSRKTIKWPFQEIREIDMSPWNCHFLGNNRSKEYVPFKLPLTFTVAPVHPDKDMEGFVRYATRLGEMKRDDIKKIIEGIVNGETRAFVGKMTIQEMFSDPVTFKKFIVETIQKQVLYQYGVEIHNANIEEMLDEEGNSYFENLKRKALEEANTTSRVAVSEARKEGDIGEKNREVTTRKQRSVMEADAKQTESMQNQKMSDYTRELNITMTTNAQQEHLAKIEAHKTTESKKIEVESDLNKQRQAQELERLRSEQVVKITAEAEALIKKTEADSNALKIKTGAEAESIKLRAMGEAEAIKMKAEAMFFEKIKNADAIKATLEAQAQGLEKMYEASKSNPEMAKFYLSLEKGVFNRDGLFSVIADKHALAIRDMHPKINIWNTGPSNSGTNISDVITNLSKSVPPILDAIQQQTGIKLPSFLVDQQKESKPKISSLD